MLNRTEGNENEDQDKAQHESPRKLILFCVAVWFILRGASCFVMPCSLSSCFFNPFSIMITRLGGEGACLCAFPAAVCLYCTR